MTSYEKMMGLYEKLVKEAIIASKTEVGAIRHSMNKWRRLSLVKSLSGVNIGCDTCSLCARHRDGVSCALNGKCCLLKSGRLGCLKNDSLYSDVDHAFIFDNLSEFKESANKLYLRLRRALAEVIK